MDILKLVLGAFFEKTEEKALSARICLLLTKPTEKLKDMPDVSPRYCELTEFSEGDIKTYLQDQMGYDESGLGKIINRINGLGYIQRPAMLYSYIETHCIDWENRYL